MSQPADRDEVVVTDARRADGTRVDVRVAGGRVAEVTAPGQLEARADVQAGGALVLPQFAEPHCHLDRILTAGDGDASASLDDAIAWWRAVREQLEDDEVAERAGRGLERLARWGVRRVRTHVDVGAVTNGVALDGVTAAADQHDDVDAQVVAFAGPPVTGRAGADNRAALREAMGRGAQLVGGAPWRDPSPREALEVMLAVAGEAGCGVDVHLDETTDPAANSLETLAELVEASAFPHPVAASHCVSLAFRPDAEQRRLAARLAAAGIAVIALPATNLYLQGRDHPTGTGSAPRGLTTIAALREAGVLVAAGADNIEDPFCPVNRGDPRDTARLLVLAAHCSPAEALAMVSSRAWQVLGLAAGELNAGEQTGDLAEGAPAALMLVDAPSVRAFVAGHGDVVCHLT